MQLAHIGVAVFIAGVTVVTSYQTEKDVKMNLGDTVSVGGYEFRLKQSRSVSGAELSGGACRHVGHKERRAGDCHEPRKARLYRFRERDV